MNSRQLEYFLAVARDLNFTKAAESLYVSQTAVTQQIKALEDQLGVQLFLRTKRKVMLTPAGKLFQSEAVCILNRMEAAVGRLKEISDGFAGSLNIGFTLGVGSTAISDWIQAFNRKFPNISMRFKSMSPSMLLQQLKAGEIDLALGPMFHEKYFSGLHYKCLLQSNYIAVLPRDHALAESVAITWQELSDEPLILATSPGGEIGEDTSIVDNFLRQGYKPNVAERIEDVETILLMVSANMGVTILPDYLAIPMATRGKIVTIPFGTKNDWISIIAAWNPRNDNPSLDRILPFLGGKEEAL